MINLKSQITKPLAPRLILLIFFILFLPISQAFAENILVIDSDKQFNLAEHYFSTGEYFRAIGEYERFVYFFPEDERVELAMHKIGMSYFESKQFRKAINAFTAIIDKPNEFQVSSFKFQVSSFITKAYFMISKCHVKLNAPGAGITNLQNLIAIAEDRDVRDEVHYRIGWIYLETAAWDRARSFFGKISPENKDKYRLKKLSAELDRESSIPKKLPGLAGFLSILPGAGYLYCGRYRDAATAFLLNGALMYAAYESFDNGNEALGGLITFVGLGFYTGSIYGSISSVHKYNRTKNMGFIENLKRNTKIGLSGGLKNDGIAVSFQYAF
ncbi:tetratricopeptide repeat protein [Desulfonema magnum]|uniref:Tetratricopeptide repeat-containing protein n=1 Tax=Desulfonema magnum TaxID=45655 RepID=A0A975GTQ8_9BACT|nr:tetratricopeptide repeat protein [Desulfonema magnum]QTA93237.1 Tetratricopeptide repeat-containing protein [Desulfonema magnum]